MIGMVQRDEGDFLSLSGIRTDFLPRMDIVDIGTTLQPSDITIVSEKLKDKMKDAQVTDVFTKTHGLVYFYFGIFMFYVVPFMFILNGSLINRTCIKNTF